MKIAVLIPCFNEELSVGDVVTQFRSELPDATIYVYDNNSSDHTAERALAAGALVFRERRQGKGFVVQSMFRQVDADVYVLVDGDGTYPPDAVHRLIAPIVDGSADMVIGSRLHSESDSQFKALNRFGNGLFLQALNGLFRVRLTDLLSGYRAFNRLFVVSLPLVGGGFEIETELTIKALERGFRIVEIPVNLCSRLAGSASKIRIVSDGLIIGNTILALARDYKPLTVFGGTGLAAVVVGSSLLSKMPFVGGGLFVLGLLATNVGLILHTVARRFQDLEYLLRVAVGERMRAEGYAAGRGTDVHPVARQPQ